MTFKVGDTVQLKSGSPVMTVTGSVPTAEGKQLLRCTWFDKTDNERTSAYPPEALKACSSESAS
jgi:uncharacterized protein YodC (DUF2158 family)